MTRLKELRRIETAIEDRNREELRWAKSYCEMRLQVAGRRDHAQYWQEIEKKVKSALLEVGMDSN